MFQEPPPTNYDLHFSVFGIPVRVHPWFWIISVLLGMGYKDPVLILTWVAVVFISILIHELGHAVMARAQGSPAHIVLYSFGGLAVHQATRHDMRSRILISAAGPGAGFLFAAFILAAIHAAGHPISSDKTAVLFWPEYEAFASPVLDAALGDLLFVNILWGLVNLLPIYPLDGGQISRELFINYDDSRPIQNSLYLSIAAAGGVALWGLTQDRTYLAIMFGWLAYSNYQQLQIQRGGGGGFGQGRW